MADGNKASADGKRRVGGGAQTGATRLYFDVDLENATSVQTHIRGWKTQKNKWSEHLQKGHEDDWGGRMKKMEKKEKWENKAGEESEWWISPFSRFEGDTLLAAARAT